MKDAVKVLVVVAACLGAGGVAFGQVNLLTEDFETWPPAGWTIQNNGGDCVWESTATTGRTNYAGGSGEAADADSDVCGSNTTMDTSLLTPVLNIPGATSVTLDFVAGYNDLTSGGGDFFEVRVAVDGGSWTQVLYWDEDHDGYGPGEAVSLDLSSLIAGGASTLQIEFHYVCDSWDWWAEVDQVSVTADQIASGADLAITKGTTVSGTLAPGDQFTYNLSVTNNGPGDATGVVVTDALPAGLAYVSDTCGGSWDAGSSTWTWTIGNLAAAASSNCDLTVEVQPGASGTITNTASVTANESDPDPANSQASADVQVSSSVPGIPALSGGGVLLMLVLLAGGALILLRRSA